MPTTDFMDYKTSADIQGHFDIAFDLLLKKENFSHGEWPIVPFHGSITTISADSEGG